MKNFLIWFSLLISFNALTQNSIQVAFNSSVIPANGTIFALTNANATTTANFDIKNISGNTYSYYVKRYDVFLFIDTFSQASAKFSFMGINYSASTYSAGPLTLSPGQNAGPANLLVAMLDEADVFSGKSEVKYTISNSTLPNDTLQFTLKYNFANLNWVSKPTFNGAQRQNAVGFSIGSKGFVGTGNDGASKNDFWYFDAVLNSWTQVANFPGTARQNAVGFSIGNDGYVGTGNDGGLKNDFWRYNSATNTWSQVANFPGTARQNAVGFSIGTDGYVGTGNDGGLKNDFWRYNSATNTWSQVANFAGTARENAVGFSMSSCGYIGTGNDGGLKNDFWQYYPPGNVWIQKASFAGSARQGATGVGSGNVAFLGTGNDGTNKNDIWEYDVTADLWDKKLNFTGTARSSSTSFLIGNSAYFGTGNDGTNKNDFWECKPSPAIIGIEKYYLNSNRVKIEVYPNPSFGIFNVKVDTYELIKLEVYDLKGRKLNYSYTFNNNCIIDLGSEPKGNYILKIYFGKQEYSQKVSLY